MHGSHIFDDLSRVVATPQGGWRKGAIAIVVNLGGKLATGLAIGVGIAVGRALAG